jgi:thiol-disulfide isomerase/thioredoxin
MTPTDPSMPPAPPTAPARRRWLLRLAALAAYGMGTAAWRLRSTHNPSSEALETLMGHAFDTPEGGQLVLGSLRGQALIVNVWATWCAPCREEIPLLSRLQAARSAKNLQVVGIAIDGLDRVRQYDRDTPLGYRIGVAGVGLITLLKALGDEQGALPFSLVFDRQGALRGQRLGIWSAADLERAADQALA